MSANITCQYGLPPSTQVVSGHVCLDLRQGEVLYIQCEGNTTLYSDLILTAQPEIHCQTGVHNNGNSAVLNTSWHCPAVENTNITISGIRKPLFNDEELVKLITRVHNLTKYIEQVNTTPVSDYTTSSGPSTSTESPDIGQIQQSNKPVTDEPTTATENKVTTTAAREYPLYVVLCVLFIPSLVLAGVVVLLIMVVVKCCRKNKKTNDIESARMGERNNGNDGQQNTPNKVQDEANQTINSNIGDTSSDNLTPNS